MSEKGLPFLGGETDFHKTSFFQNEKRAILLSLYAFALLM